MAHAQMPSIIRQQHSVEVTCVAVWSRVNKFAGSLHSSYRPVDPQLSASLRGLPAAYGGVPMPEMGSESHNVELVALQVDLLTLLSCPKGFCSEACVAPVFVSRCPV
jgi:hypothetical protein